MNRAAIIRANPLGKALPAWQALCRLSQGMTALPSAIYYKNGVRSYWGFKNFGDLITPKILKQLCVTPINSPFPNLADLLFVGSILDSVRPSFGGYILGSGFLRKGADRTLPFAKICGVRGRLTKDRLNIKHDVALGDGGLILSEFVNYTYNIKYPLGVIPHYADCNHASFELLRRRFSGEVLFIDVRRDPEVVLRELTTCNNIVSSSLHGLVLADSLGIPNKWIDVGSREHFKYFDYYSAFNVRRKPHLLRGDESVSELCSLALHPPDLVEKRKAEISVALNDIVHRILATKASGPEGPRAP